MFTFVSRWVRTVLYAPLLGFDLGFLFSSVFLRKDGHRWLSGGWWCSGKFFLPSHASKFSPASDDEDGFESAEEGEEHPSTSSLQHSPSAACEPVTALQPHPTLSALLLEPISPRCLPASSRPPRSEFQPCLSSSASTVATQAQPASIRICFGLTPDCVAEPVTFKSRLTPASCPHQPTVSTSIMISRNGRMCKSPDLTSTRYRPHPLTQVLQSPSAPYQVDTSLPGGVSRLCRGSRTDSALSNRCSISSPCLVSDLRNCDAKLIGLNRVSPQVSVAQTSLTSHTSCLSTRSAAPSPCTESDSGTCEDPTISPPTIRLEPQAPQAVAQVSRSSKVSHGRRSARAGIQRLAQLLSPSAKSKKAGEAEIEKSRKSSGSERADRSCLTPSPMPRLVTDSDEVRRAAATSWRSTISEGDYRRVLTQHGPNEIHRQQIIWELVTTETDFIGDLRKVLSLFADPLRQAWDGGWISGVPPSVSELFDELGSILKFHEQIHSAILQLVHTTSTPPIFQVAPTLLPLIPNLRVYERYLIIFEPVTKLLESHLVSTHEQSRFGEFLRIQSIALKTVGKLNLISFLLKPIQRLMKYPLFFRELSGRSSATHPDHLSTLELLKLTDEAIRELQSAKVKQEEQARLETIEANLRGLPSGFVLATDGRSVLCEGVVSRLRLEANRGQSKNRVRSTSHAPRMFCPEDRPPSQVSDWSDRSRSMKSMESASSSATSSFWDASCEQADLRYAIPPADPASTTPPTSINSRSSAASSSSPSCKKVSSPYVFVMNDMVVFAEPSRRSRKHPSYRLIGGIGLSRVLRVSELVTGVSARLGEDSTYQSHLEIELEPLNRTSGSINPKISDSSLSTSMIIHLTLSDSQSLDRWYQAFQCSSLGRPVNLQSAREQEFLGVMDARHEPLPDYHHPSFPVIRQLRGRARSLFTLSAGGSAKNRQSTCHTNRSVPPVPPLPSFNLIQNSAACSSSLTRIY